ncbi:uncharacterized protein LOC143356856 isoform X2 [Halictus rubicundus]|uniref:uncharacterized protein LOC143356856 isoform X2 n=1 Tax=Halictus rubicundus TaxID=77578 RepID=UPI0040360299
MIMSLGFAIVWLYTDKLMRRPQIMKERNISDESNDLPTTDSSANTDISEVVEYRAKISKRESKMKEMPGKLDPIPQLEKFPSLSSISQSISIRVSVVWL